jgi:hypothetical protein
MAAVARAHVFVRWFEQREREPWEMITCWRVVRNHEETNGKVGKEEEEEEEEDVTASLEW